MASRGSVESPLLRGRRFRGGRSSGQDGVSLGMRSSVHEEFGRFLSVDEGMQTPPLLPKRGSKAPGSECGSVVLERKVETSSPALEIGKETLPVKTVTSSQLKTADETARQPRPPASPPASLRHRRIGSPRRMRRRIQVPQEQKPADVRVLPLPEGTYYYSPAYSDLQKCKVYLTSDEVRRCKDVYDRLGCIRITDAKKMMQVADELGIPCPPLDTLREIMLQCFLARKDAPPEDVIGCLFPSQYAFESWSYESRANSPLIDLRTFLSIVHQLKVDYMTSSLDGDIDLIEAFQAMGGRHDKTGNVELNQLDHTARTFRLTIDIPQLVRDMDEDNDGSISFNEFSSLLSNTAAKAAEVFVKLGGAPDPEIDPGSKTVPVPRIMQNLHLLQPRDAALAQDVVRLAGLLCGENLTFHEFQEGVVQPILEAERDPQGEQYVKDQLALAEKMRHYVDLGVGIGRTSDSEATLIDLLERATGTVQHSKGMARLDEMMASHTSTRALHAILGRHFDMLGRIGRKAGVEKDPKRRAITAASPASPPILRSEDSTFIPLLTTTPPGPTPEEEVEMEQRKQRLQRAALAIMVQRAAESRTTLGKTQLLFLKGISRTVQQMTADREDLLSERERSPILSPTSPGAASDATFATSEGTQHPPVAEESGGSAAAHETECKHEPIDTRLAEMAEESHPRSRSVMVLKRAGTHRKSEVKLPRKPPSPKPNSARRPDTQQLPAFEETWDRSQILMSKILSLPARTPAKNSGRSSPMRQKLAASLSFISCTTETAPSPRLGPSSKMLTPQLGGGGLGDLIAVLRRNRARTV